MFFSPRCQSLQSDADNLRGFPRLNQLEQYLSFSRLTRPDGWHIIPRSVSIAMFVGFPPAKGLIKVCVIPLLADGYLLGKQQPHTNS
jgi:hypothetical protein